MRRVLVVEEGSLALLLSGKMHAWTVHSAETRSRCSNRNCARSVGASNICRSSRAAEDIGTDCTLIAARVRLSTSETCVPPIHIAIVPPLKNGG